MTSAPEGLPRPTAGAVTVYFLGPGFGESQVVVLPDDRVLVVDGCSREGVDSNARRPRGGRVGTTRCLTGACRASWPP